MRRAAPSGAGNGNHRHGEQTQARKAVWAKMMKLVRISRKMLDALAEWHRLQGRE